MSAQQRKPRMTLSLDDDSIKLLTRLQAFTGLSPAQTIQKIFPAHLTELWDYLHWLEEFPQEKNHLGKFLIHNYGPTSLREEIKKLDPAYVPESEKTYTH